VTTALQAAVAAADSALVLPTGDRRAAVAVRGPLTLCAALDLGDGHALAVLGSADGARWTVPVIMNGVGLRRAGPGDGTAERLVRRLADGRDGGSFVLTRFDVADMRGERAVTVDQTDESVIVGERAVVKYAVRLPPDGQPGSPAAARLGTLAAAGFADMPAVWGLVSLDDVLLATVVEYLPGAQDGWDWAVADVRSFAGGALSETDALAPARRIGAAIARMHAALATAGRTHASADVIASWRGRISGELEQARRVVTGPEGDRLRRLAPRIEEVYADLADVSGTPLIGLHGDLHVGQVLRHGDRYAVIDFDGNPVLSPGDRAAPAPAAVDVASMAASLDHVGRVVLYRTPGVDAAAVRHWIAAAQDEFSAGYATTAAACGSADLLDRRLSTVLRVAQEVREYLYAVRHLPHWVYVPDMALADLLSER
jgi:maltokinase